MAHLEVSFDSGPMEGRPLLRREVVVVNAATVWMGYYATKVDSDGLMKSD